MSDLDKIYRSKLVTPQELIAQFKPGSLIHFGIWYGQPYGVMKAVAQYGRETRPLYISVVFTTGPAQFLTLPGVSCLTAFLGPFERAAQKANNNIYFCPVQFSDANKMLTEWHTINFIVFRVAPMDERGYFNFSLTSSWEDAALRRIREVSPKTRIVFEVNRNMPRICGLEEFGNHELHVSNVDFIIEDDAPMLDFGTPPPTETEQAIAANVAALIEDRATIQLGFGTIPMAIGKLLTSRRELGIHSEMICEAHMDLIEAGSVTNAHKGIYDGISVATFALGEERLRRRMKENKAFAMLPVEAINDVRAISRNNKMMSINSVLMVDLAGQACAHCIGSKTYSGVGGAFEFCYGAQMSPGGKGIACLPSTATLKDGRVVSNIVAQFEAGTRITIPEHTVDWVVTEYGAARLKLMNMDERAAALIGIAHPDFREELSRQAAANGIRLSKLSSLPATPAQFFLKRTAARPMVD